MPVEHCRDQIFPVLRSALGVRMAGFGCWLAGAHMGSRAVCGLHLPSRIFGFAPIPVIQPVSRTLRSGHPIREDPRPEKLLHGEDFRAFHLSPRAGRGTGQAGADREGPAIDQTLADAVLHSDPERRSRSVVPSARASSGSSHASQPPLTGWSAPRPRRLPPDPSALRRPPRSLRQRHR